MIDNNVNKYLRNLGVSCDDVSQFKEFNCEEELTPIQARMYFLMLNGSLQRGNEEKLYGWCGRIGLSNSTVFGIFKKNNKKMHKSVAEKIAGATGSDIDWVQNGVGVPFPIYCYDQIIDQQIEEALYSFNDNDLSEEIEPPKNLIKKDLDEKILEDCFKTTDEALKETFRKMDADNKAKFILQFYSALFDEVGQSLDKDVEELLKLSIFTIEVALTKTRRDMSPKNKVKLILEVYNLYDCDVGARNATIQEFDEYQRRKAKNA